VPSESSVARGSLCVTCFALMSSTVIIAVMIWLRFGLRMPKSTRGESSGPTEGIPASSA